MPKRKTTTEKSEATKPSAKKAPMTAKKTTKTASAMPAKSKKGSVNASKTSPNISTNDKNTKPLESSRGSNATKSPTRVTNEKKQNGMQLFNSSIKNGWQSISTNTRKVNRNIWFALLGALVVVIVLAFLFEHFFVVAWVNDMPITRFSQYSLLNQRYGTSATDELVTEKLIEDQANQKHITVSDQEITQEINNIAQQQGGMDQLNQVLASEGINQTELHTLVRLQLLEQKMFNVSDAEIKQYESQNKDSLPADFESSPSAKQTTEANIKNQLLQQKVTDWLNTAKNSSQVKLGALF